MSRTGWIDEAAGAAGGSERRDELAVLQRVDAITTMHEGRERAVRAANARHEAAHPTHGGALGVRESKGPRDRMCRLLDDVEGGGERGAESRLPKDEESDGGAVRECRVWTVHVHDQLLEGGET